MACACALPTGARAEPSARPVPAHTAAPSELAAVASHPRWLALLHHGRRRLDRETEAALRESGFLLSWPSPLDPERELVATLAAFHDPRPERARAARCRFPARHRWLAALGLTSPARGPCPELDPWRERIGRFTLTLIYPEAFLGNPASMFGHTLLRIDPVPADGGDPDPLLGWAIDYTADAQGEVGALYLMRGLVGGYRGRFSLAPYYEKTKVYSDWQDRDIWEYPLDLSEEERELLLLHVWELRDARLPYYFFTQNCSEKLVELIEVARPGLGRGGGFPPAVAPVDTLRAIDEAGDPLGTPRLRASPATLLQERMAWLADEDADLVEALAWGEIAPDDAALAGRSAEDRARILETAYDLLRHRFLAGKVDDASSRSRARALLLARSRIAAPRTPAPPATFAAAGPRLRPPDTGHGTARVALAGGIQDRYGFTELRVQPGYHELLDAPSGFAEGGQIRVLDTRVRLFPELSRVRLQELVLLDVATASPWRRPFRPLGWRFDVGLRTRLLDSDGDFASTFRLQGGVGAATAPLPGLLLYGFGELAFEAGPELEGSLGAGPVARSGLTWSTPGERFSLQLEGLAGVLTGRTTRPWLRAELAQRTTLFPDWSLVLSGRYERAWGYGHPEGRVGLVRYF